MGSGLIPSQNLGGPFVFGNLSEAGVLPGWTCNIAVCFIEHDGDFVFLQTELANCTLPLAGELHRKIAAQDIGYNHNILNL